MSKDDSDHHYKKALYHLQVELVKLQRDLIASNARVLIILEGRDAAGKDGTIKRLTEHMSPRETRIHAPGKPSSREDSEWYFQRYVSYLPAAQDFVVFNRSWYNRSGVERVMGFCTQEQAEEFLTSVVPFEQMLARDGLEIRKYYLDITKKEQKKRLDEREDDPLTQWKVSPVDEMAQKKWSAYSRARDEMIRRTSQEAAPWRIVLANDKKVARLEFIRDLLESFSYRGKSKKLVQPDRSIVFHWADNLADRLAP
ncbi:MAG TPA: polyphosphate kinase 2 [Rhizomicrobium sp.]|nr:polyphosphate kinase 2 [Rhizomicrobium sp.]